LQQNQQFTCKETIDRSKLSKKLTKNGDLRKLVAQTRLVKVGQLIAKSDGQLSCSTLLRV